MPSSASFPFGSGTWELALNSYPSRLVVQLRDLADELALVREQQYVAEANDDYSHFRVEQPIGSPNELVEPYPLLVVVLGLSSALARLLGNSPHVSMNPVPFSITEKNLACPQTASKPFVAQIRSSDQYPACSASII